MPTARDMPISDLRSSANMTKMFTIRTIPATMTNVLKTIRKLLRLWALVVALLTATCFSEYAQIVAAALDAWDGSVLHPYAGGGLRIEFRVWFAARPTTWLCRMESLSPPVFVIAM